MYIMILLSKQYSRTNNEYGRDLNNIDDAHSSMVNIKPNANIEDSNIEDLN